MYKLDMVPIFITKFFYYDVNNDKYCSLVFLLILTSFLIYTPYQIN